MPDGLHPDLPAGLPTASVRSRPPEALLVCPQCNAGVPAGALESHLRQTHQVYQFRGVRRPFHETMAVLLEALTSSRPDPRAWDLLSTIAREEHGERGDVFLAALLGQLISRLDAARRGPLAASLGELIGRSGNAGLALALAAEDEQAARHLALSVLAHLPSPWGPDLTGTLQALLLDRRLPAEAHLDALAAFLRREGDTPLAGEMLQTLVGGLGKARSIDRLRELEKRVGQSPAIDALCAQLEERLRMTCPRCSIELRRPAMVRHLWEEHRLILDGRRVREPWTVIEEWVSAYRSRPDPALLDRCQSLAERVDAEQGPVRLTRLLLARGVADPEAAAALLEEAREQHASCCPWCYAPVPVPREVAPLTITARRGRLSARGYLVDVSSHGLRTSLEVRTPSQLIYRGREPHARWARRGATILLVGPPVLLALAWSLLGPAPLGPVLVLLLLALLAALLVRWRWRERVAPADRARNYAWTLLAPRLHEEGFDLDDSAFLAGLARLSEGDGYGPLREPLLASLVRRTEAAVIKGVGSPGHLAALCRLLVEDAAAAGLDPVPVIVGRLAHCFDGRLPLTFAEGLLSDWQGANPAPAWWTPGNVARLRVLLCDRAFEAGFEVGNLLDAGQTAPALGAVLGVDDGPGLAALRLLWSLRTSRPWDRCGAAVTVFDLAADPARAGLLGRYPDLLLRQEEPAWELAETDGESAPVRILLCVRGMVLQDTVFQSAPRVVEVRQRREGVELRLGADRFVSPTPLDELVMRIERWFRYAFSEFLSRLGDVQTWQSPDRSAILRAWGAVSCPECHGHLLARVGQVGLALDE
jgi:hypothetical protein